MELAGASGPGERDGKSWSGSVCDMGINRGLRGAADWNQAGLDQQWCACAGWASQGGAEILVLIYGQTLLACTRIKRWAAV